MTNDMTRGNPTRLIISFTLPVLFGNLCQQLYGMVDSIIVGRAISMEALAAVGATSGISFLVIGCIQGLTAGFSVITAQRFGAGDYEGVKRSVATSALLSLAATVLLTAAGILTARPLLEVMNTPADIIEDSYAYIIVIYYGVAATAFYNLLSCIIRALGDSKTPLIFLVFASFLNSVGSAVYHHFSYGSGRRGLGHGAVSRGFRTFVPGLRLEKISSPAHGKAALDL